MISWWRNANIPYATELSGRACTWVEESPRGVGASRPAAGRGVFRMLEL